MFTDLDCLEKRVPVFLYLNFCFRVYFVILLYTDNPSFHSFLNLFLYLQFIISVFPFFFSFPNSLALSFSNLPSSSPPPLALRNWIHVQRGAGFGTFVDCGVKGHLSGWPCMRSGPFFRFLSIHFLNEIKKTASFSLTEINFDNIFVI